MIIYKITNKINNKSYIGQTTKNILIRWKQHCSDKKEYCRILSRAIKKYNRENFEIKVLTRCNTIEEMNYRESYYIKLFNTLSPNGYNLKIGGGNKFASKETKIKMSQSQKGKRLGKNNGMFGKTHSLENKQKMSYRMKQRVGTKNSMFGKHLTEETKKLLSNKLKGRKISLEQKINISNALKGKQKSKEHSENLSKSNNFRKIKIFCTNNNMTYDSIMSASRSLGLSSGNISKVLNGVGKSVKGFMFTKIMDN